MCLQHHVIQDCKSEENEQATDNALSALAALLEHHKDVLDANQVGTFLCLWLADDVVLAHGLRSMSMQKHMHQKLAQWTRTSHPTTLISCALFASAQGVLTVACFGVQSALCVGVTVLVHLSGTCLHCLESASFTHHLGCRGISFELPGLNDDLAACVNLTLGHATS